MSSVFGMESPFDNDPALQVVPNEVVVTDRDDKPVVVSEESKAYPLALTLREKQAALEALEAANAERLHLQDILKKRKAELQEAMDIVAQEMHQIEIELYDYRADKRTLSSEIWELRRLLAQAIQDELNSQRLLKNKQEFDKKIGQYKYSADILEHQRDGAFILATNMRAILGDKRGAGKTLTSIASWDMNQSQRILVIVPDDVVSNFVNEIHYWAPHRNVVQLGKLPRDQREFAISMLKRAESFTVVINYSAWRKDKTLIPSLIALRFDTVVMDEAHEMKNTSTSAYKGVRQIVLAENVCPQCSGEIVHNRMVMNREHFKCKVCTWDSYDNPGEHEFLDRCSVKMVTPMTGTVILNKPQDLFAQLSLIDPVNFREVKDFLRIYCTQDWYTSKWVFKPGGLDSLKVKLAGKYIAREGVKTPGQTVYTHDLTLDPMQYPDQYRVITQLSKHAAILLSSGKKMDILAQIALITRKRQANVWPAGIKIRDEDGNIVFDAGEDVNESIKIDKLVHYSATEDEWAGLIPEFTEQGDMELGARVLVFSQFKGPLKELERRLKDANISVVRFDGDTPQSIRDEAKIDFDRKYCDQPGYVKKWQVLLCNYRTGGVGLNFTGCTETIILDKEWNPGKEDQAFGRTDRLGQTEHTNVHIIRVEKTIDAWMDQINTEKADMIAGFNEATAPLSTQLLDALKSGEIL